MIANSQHLINDESGNLFDESRFSGLQVEHTRLVAQVDALGLRSGSTQRDRKTGMTGEISTLRNRADTRCPEHMESFRGDDRAASALVCSRPWMGFQSAWKTPPRSTLLSLAANGRDGRVFRRPRIFEAKLSK